MKTYNISLIAVVALFMATATGCSGKKGAEAANADKEALTGMEKADIRGQWYIENIVFSDSDYVRPDETSSSMKQYIVFEDSTYFIMTNCNSFSGSYSVKGDSITLGDGLMTEMACDDMRTEDALRRILPRISTIDVQNDSVVRLNGSTAAEYILLCKAKKENKSSDVNYFGKFEDRNDGSALVIGKAENGYNVSIRLFRLTEINDCIGKLKDSILIFTGTDASGNPISGEISISGNTAKLVFTDSTWDYLPAGTTYIFERKHLEGV